MTQLDPSIPLNATGANPNQPQQQMSNALNVLQLKDAMQQRDRSQQTAQNEKRAAKKIDALANRGTGLFLKYRSLIDDGKLTHNAAQAAMQEDFKREIGGLSSERDDNGMPLFTQEELQGFGQEFNAGELGTMLPRLMGAKNALDMHFKQQESKRQGDTLAETKRHNQAMEGKKPAGSNRPVAVADPKSSTGFTFQTPEAAVGQPAPAPRAQNSTKYSAKELQAARDKVRVIGVAKKQLAKLKESRDKIKDSFASGPGILPGAMTEDASMFDGDVDTMRDTITSITRTPGVGAMSDFETRLNQAKLPTRNEFEATRDRKISALEDMLDSLETSYSDLLSDPGPSSGQPDANQTIEDLVEMYSEPQQ